MKFPWTSLHDLNLPDVEFHPCSHNSIDGSVEAPCGVSWALPPADFRWFRMEAEDPKMNAKSWQIFGIVPYTRTALLNLRGLKFCLEVVFFCFFLFFCFFGLGVNQDTVVVV